MYIRIYQKLFRSSKEEKLWEDMHTILLNGIKAHKNEKKSQYICFSLSQTI